MIAPLHSSSESEPGCDCSRCLAAEARQNEIIRTLASGFQHHLNNQLQTMYGHATFLAGSALTPAMALSAQAMLSSARKLGELSARLAACSRARVAGVETVDIAASLGTWSSSIADLCGQDVVLTIVPPESPIVVRAPRGMRAVFLLLISNAVEAMLATERKVLEIRCGVCGPGGPPFEQARPCCNVASQPYGYIEVEDCGEGIAAQDLPRVFDPFFTTRLPGRGLGLFEVLNAMQGCGGLVSVHSSGARAGTRARLMLRLADASTDGRDDGGAPASGSGVFSPADR